MKLPHVPDFTIIYIDNITKDIYYVPYLWNYLWKLKAIEVYKLIKELTKLHHKFILFHNDKIGTFSIKTQKYGQSLNCYIYCNVS